MLLLHSFFGDRIISKGVSEDIFWPPYSPDLNPCDFFLWGRLKDIVFAEEPKTLSELKEKITLNLNKISLAECQRVIFNFNKRLNVCIKKEGKHFSNIIN
ncbi:uncharacterized protein B4U79_03946 [Dinothrombium tinctorium]|uniref:Tc1-like transposase DDE domain-containing protein n=1 Tax=Dinothrombium tinctorium TaxID=1965070 RepID=A0A443QGM3_9ACAR|nr:uncharacterized protein B4U79_03946 [Dinothrombium tinctorium]